MLAILYQSFTVLALASLRVLSLLLFPTVGVRKAVITLQPPWVSIFQNENVTLWCEGLHLPGGSSTQWLLNNTVIQVSTPSYRITEATFKDSGEYRCQTGLSMTSDPVQLEIHRGEHGTGQEGWESQGLLWCGCQNALCLSVCLCLPFSLRVYVRLYMSERISFKDLLGQIKSL